MDYYINSHYQIPQKSRTRAIMLAFFLGFWGVHKFYLGDVVQGVIFLLLSFTGIPALISFINAIEYLCASDMEFQDKFVSKK